MEPAGTETTCYNVLQIQSGLQSSFLCYPITQQGTVRRTLDSSLERNYTSHSAMATPNSRPAYHRTSGLSVVGGKCCITDSDQYPFRVTTPSILRWLTASSFECSANMRYVGSLCQIPVSTLMPCVIESETKSLRDLIVSLTDDFETSETSGRYKRCGGPPKVKPPNEKPQPPKPKEGDKPPPPVREPQVKTHVGVDF